MHVITNSFVQNGVSRGHVNLRRKEHGAGRRERWKTRPMWHEDECGGDRELKGNIIFHRREKRETTEWFIIIITIRIIVVVFTCAQWQSINPETPRLLLHANAAGECEKKGTKKEEKETKIHQKKLNELWKYANKSKCKVNVS